MSTKRNAKPNIKQGLTAKWQAFRAWQETPVTYRMDEHEHVLVPTVPASRLPGTRLHKLSSVTIGLILQSGSLS